MRQLEPSRYVGIFPRHRLSTMNWTLLLHVFATLTMFGVIWIVQLVHYPLFRLVSAENWSEFKAQHERRITWIVGPTMLLELGTGVALVFAPIPGIPAALAIGGALLIGATWASTAFVQVPLHAALDGSFDKASHEKLVRTNWIRTVAWSARAPLVLAMLYFATR